MATSTSVSNPSRSAGNNGNANSQSNGSPSSNPGTGNAHQRSRGRKKKKKGKNNKEISSDEIGSSFKGQVRSGSLQNVVITHGSGRPYQYKKLIKSAKTYAAEQRYDRVPDIIETLKPITKAEFFKSKQPDRRQWQYCEEKDYVEDLDKPDVKTRIKVWSNFDKSLKKTLMSEFEAERESEREEYKECLKNQRAMITIILGQLCPTTLTAVEQNKKFKEVKKDGDLARMLEILRDLCISNDDHGSTYRPLQACKTTVALLGARRGSQRTAAVFKEEIKVKYASAWAMAQGFPLGLLSLKYALEGDGKKLS